ncbi:MFS transporter [Blastococcus sp. TF02-09]|nr:MFS transporter [Blastococcus sp. TF02-9]
MQTIETDVPARLDRLPFSRFHRLVIIGLGTVWILDGLEVTIVGSIAARMVEAGSGIEITASQIGLAASIYIVGACTGALLFGQLTDRFGRKKLFLLTLGVYITATVLTAFAWTPWFFYVCRFFTGAGIGGEYAAINSAIDELIPSRLRGRVDLLINGSYWLGAAFGSGASLLLLDEDLLGPSVGWRISFVMGAVLGLVILVVRRHVPESPRWLFIHGQEDEANRTVEAIEREVREETGEDLEEPHDTLKIRQRHVIPFREIAKVAFTRYPKRAVLGLALFVGQAFLYNGFTFNLGTLMSTYFGVASGFVPVFLIVYAVGNFLGPVLLGRLFDTVGRKPMISLAYLGSAVMAVVTAVLFTGLNSWTFILLLGLTFFLASSGASAAYLTVSEIFPMETRALAIAFFYAVGTGIGGIVGPLLFGRLIESGDAGALMTGFFIAAAVMALGGLAEIVFGVKAENASLESIAMPLTAEHAQDGDGGDDGDDDAQDDVGARDAEDPAARRRDREAADRIRARVVGREQRERRGLRRYRPGPGQSLYSPRMTITTPGRDERSLDRHIAAVEAVLRQRGTLTQKALAEAVGARWWGPGQLRLALREAQEEGRVRRVGRDRYAAEQDQAAAGPVGSA